MGLLTLVGCGPVAERTLIEQFFAASRLRDLTALSKVATVVFASSKLPAAKREAVEEVCRRLSVEIQEVTIR